MPLPWVNHLGGVARRIDFAALLRRRNDQVAKLVRRSMRSSYPVVMSMGCQ